MSTVTVIGGGLVGSLVSCFLAERGFSVNLFEMRDDPRVEEVNFTGKSINLAISERGRSALRQIGIEDEIISKHAIPMKARLIHDLNGNLRPIPYSIYGDCIYSVSRKFVNQSLLTLAEKMDNVNVYFGHKVLNVDIESGKCNFLVDNSIKKTIDSPVVIGADGAYSKVRSSLMKTTLINFSQTFIDHGYLELNIPPTTEGHFAMEPNYLHIWPRDEFMMIALPNQDKSFTVTLFMPFESFKLITDEEQLLIFFKTYFPDSIDLIGKNNLIRDFLSTAPSSLVSIKCKPIHYEDKVLLLGDAAHAMVPFFGQGMNCGFEDCLILDQLIHRYNKDFSKIFKAFTETRNKDHHTICDLAMYNYIEMRHLVNTRSFIIRKKIDQLLYRIFPSYWTPLYNLVTFTMTPYSICFDRKKKQDKILEVALYSLLMMMTVPLVYSLTGSGRNIN